MKNGLDEQYIDLLKDILKNGVEKQTRNGKTLSVFGRSIRYNFKDGKFPLLTTKKMPFKTIVTELLWFLRGDTNIKFLIDNGCNIWNGDAYKAYEKWYDDMSKTTPFEVPRKFTQDELIKAISLDEFHAKQFGELGPIYGKQWRSWEWNTWPGYQPAHTQRIDQIANLIKDLKTNPDSRRLMVTAWNVGELDKMVLPPCHYGFQVYTRELSDEERLSWMKKNKSNVILPMRDPNVTDFSIDEWFRPYGVPKRAISLMFNMRSCDVPLGLPFNIASYGLLLEIIAKTVNMIPDELIGNLGDAHIYLNQIDGVKEQLTRNSFPLPTLKHLKTDEFYKSLSEDSSLLSHLDNTDFVVENYQSHPTIKIPLSN